MAFEGTILKVTYAVKVPSRDTLFNKLGFSLLSNIPSVESATGRKDLKISGCTYSSLFPTPLVMCRTEGALGLCPRTQGKNRYIED